jgi:lipopolysaccharide transport system ATP-binding protein
VAQQGRTVLFVSHNMAAVEALCAKVLTLDAGQKVFDGLTSEGVKAYLAQTNAPRAAEWGIGKQWKVVREVRVLNAEGLAKGCIFVGEPIIFEVGLSANAELTHATLGIGINDHWGTRVTTMITSHQGIQLPPLQKDMIVRCEIRDFALAPGTYNLKIGVASHYSDIESIDINDAFEVIGGDYWGSGKALGKSQGFVLLSPSWTIKTSD